MTDLITRLSKLDAPDREVDAEIDRAFGLLVDIYPLSGPMTDYPEPVGYTETRHYTASVDAAIALAERVLPGHRWSAGFSRHVPHNAQIWVPSGSGYYEGESDANRAIALLIAILRAKEASNA